MPVTNGPEGMRPLQHGSGRDHYGWVSREPLTPVHSSASKAPSRTTRW